MIRLVKDVLKASYVGRWIGPRLRKCWRKEAGLVTLAERVTLARERLGLNQSQLARRASLPVAAVWQFEHGDRTPSVRSLSKLADALTVSTDWLLGRAEGEPPVDPRLAQISQGWGRLSERDREAIAQLFRVLAGEPSE